MKKIIRNLITAVVATTTLVIKEQTKDDKKENETPGCVYERRLKIYGYN